jgi:hypothetical protein
VCGSCALPLRNNCICGAQWPPKSPKIRARQSIASLREAGAGGSNPLSPTIDAAWQSGGTAKTVDPTDVEPGQPPR